MHMNDRLQGSNLMRAIGRDYLDTHPEATREEIEQKALRVQEVGKKMDEAIEGLHPLEQIQTPEEKEKALLISSAVDAINMQLSVVNNKADVDAIIEGVYEAAKMYGEAPMTLEELKRSKEIAELLEMMTEHYLLNKLHAVIPHVNVGLEIGPYKDKAKQELEKEGFDEELFEKEWDKLVQSGKIFQLFLRRQLRRTQNEQLQFHFEGLFEGEGKGSFRFDNYFEKLKEHEQLLWQTLLTDPEAQSDFLFVLGACFEHEINAVSIIEQEMAKIMQYEREIDTLQDQIRSLEQQEEQMRREGYYGGLASKKREINTELKKLNRQIHFNKLNLLEKTKQVFPSLRVFAKQFPFVDEVVSHLERRIAVLPIVSTEQKVQLSSRNLVAHKAMHEVMGSYAFIGKEKIKDALLDPQGDPVAVAKQVADKLESLYPGDIKGDTKEQPKSEIQRFLESAKAVIGERAKGLIHHRDLRALYEEVYEHHAKEVQNTLTLKELMGARSVETEIDETIKQNRKQLISELFLEELKNGGYTHTADKIQEIVANQLEERTGLKVLFEPGYWNVNECANYLMTSVAEYIPQERLQEIVSEVFAQKDEDGDLDIEAIAQAIAESPHLFDLLGEEFRKEIALPLVYIALQVNNISFSSSYGKELRARTSRFALAKVLMNDESEVRVRKMEHDRYQPILERFPEVKSLLHARIEKVIVAAGEFAQRPTSLMEIDPNSLISEVTHLIDKEKSDLKKAEATGYALDDNERAFLEMESTEMMDENKIYALAIKQSEQALNASIKSLKRQEPHPYDQGYTGQYYLSDLYNQHDKYPYLSPIKFDKIVKEATGTKSPYDEVDLLFKFYEWEEKYPELAAYDKQKEEQEELDEAQEQQTEAA